MALYRLTLNRPLLALYLLTLNRPPLALYFVTLNRPLLALYLLTLNRPPLTLYFLTLNKPLLALYLLTLNRPLLALYRLTLKVTIHDHCLIYVVTCTSNCAFIERLLQFFKQFVFISTLNVTSISISIASLFRYLLPTK